MQRRTRGARCSTRTTRARVSLDVASFAFLAWRRWLLWPGGWFSPVLQADISLYLQSPTTRSSTCSTRRPAMPRPPRQPRPTRPPLRPPRLAPLRLPLPPPRRKDQLPPPHRRPSPDSGLLVPPSQRLPSQPSHDRLACLRFPSAVPPLLPSLVRSFVCTDLPLVPLRLDDAPKIRLQYRPRSDPHRGEKGPARYATLRPCLPLRRLPCAS